MKIKLAALIFLFCLSFSCIGQTLQPIPLYYSDSVRKADSGKVYMDFKPAAPREPKRLTPIEIRQKRQNPLVTSIAILVILFGVLILAKKKSK